jgi:hypothetical protein
MFAGNEGKVDRMLRVFGGIVLLGLGVLLHSPVGVIGLVPLITGLVGYCPIYRLAGVDTCDVSGAP